MAVPQNREELLSAISQNYARLAQEFVSVPPERVAERTLEGHRGGTQMSVRDLAAYLLGWGELVLKWHARRLADLPVDFPETGFKWNQLGQLAEKFYQDYAALAYPDLLERLAQNNADIIALVENHSDSALYGSPWYDKWTMGRLIQFNTSSPYANARGRLRKWKKQQGLD